MVLNDAFVVGAGAGADVVAVEVIQPVVQPGGDRGRRSRRHQPRLNFSLKLAQLLGSGGTVLAVDAADLPLAVWTRRHIDPAYPKPVLAFVERTVTGPPLLRHPWKGSAGW